MAYIEGVLAAVPTNRKEDYLEYAKFMAQLFKDHGATNVVECWGDDIPAGKITSMPMAVQCQPDETVVFSWITWPDKAVREVGMKKCMDDPRMEGDTDRIPFDGKRMIFGGFDVILDA